MFASFSRIVSGSFVSRAYSTLTMPMRARVQRAPTRALDQNTGRGTAAFNEREQALENKAVREHEATTMQRLRNDPKVRRLRLWMRERYRSQTHIPSFRPPRSAFRTPLSTIAYSSICSPIFTTELYTFEGRRCCWKGFEGSPQLWLENRRRCRFLR